MPFDTLRFLTDNFVDPDGVIGTVGKHFQHTPQKETVRKWFSRRAVSGEWWPTLLISLERDVGQPVSLARYCEADDHDVFM